MWQNSLSISIGIRLTKILSLIIFFSLIFRINLIHSNNLFESIDLVESSCRSPDCHSDQYLDRQFEILNTSTNIRFEKNQVESNILLDLFISSHTTKIVKTFLEYKKFYFPLFNNQILIYVEFSGLSPPFVA